MKKKQEYNEYVRQKIHLHYLIQGKVAIIPASLYSDYENIHEKIHNISINDVHKGEEFPGNLLLSEALNLEADEIPGYKFEKDEKAWALYYATGGEKIDKSDIDFTSIIEDYEEFEEDSL